MSDQIRVRNTETDDETTFTRAQFDAWEDRWPGEFVEIKDEADQPDVVGTVVVEPTDENQSGVADTAPDGAVDPSIVGQPE